nr:hypothetical protein [Pseudomonas sp. YL2]
MKIAFEPAADCLQSSNWLRWPGMTLKNQRDHGGLIGFWMGIDQLGNPRTISFSQVFTPLARPSVQLIQRQPPRTAVFHVPARHRLLETERRVWLCRVNVKQIDVVKGMLRRERVIAAADFDHGQCSNPWALNVSDCFAVCATGANQKPDGTSLLHVASKL